MDNKIFNVNGRTKEQLLKAIELVMFNEYGINNLAKGWKIIPDKGLVFLWNVDKDKKDENMFPVPIDFKQCTEISWEWLNSKEIFYESGKRIEKKVSESFPMDGWDENHDHDGSNELGWRVYVEDWGHVGNNHYSVFAIKPAYCWYGK